MYACYFLSMNQCLRACKLIKFLIFLRRSVFSFRLFLIYFHFSRFHLNFHKNQFAKIYHAKISNPNINLLTLVIFLILMRCRLSCQMLRFVCFSVVFTIRMLQHSQLPYVQMFLLLIAVHMSLGHVVDFVYLLWLIYFRFLCHLSLSLAYTFTNVHMCICAYVHF